MKCLIRIGYTDIVLPDIKGIEKLVDALSKGMECDKHYTSSYKEPPVIELKRPLLVEFELLPPDTIFKASEELKSSVSKEKGALRLVHLKMIGD